MITDTGNLHNRLGSLARAIETENRKKKADRTNLPDLLSRQARIKQWLKTLNPLQA